MKNLRITFTILANNGYTALHCAVIDNHIAIANLLLRHNADINARRYFICFVFREIFLGIGDGGETCLHMAVQHGNIPMIDFLFQNGADFTLRGI